MDVVDRSWGDFESWDEHWKGCGGLLLQTLLYISRTLWHLWMVWRSIEIFSTSELFWHNRSENGNIIIGCFTMLTFLDEILEYKASQFRDTVALYGQHSGPFCLKGLYTLQSSFLPVPLSVLWVHSKSSSPCSPAQCFMSTRSIVIFAQLLRILLWPLVRYFFPRDIGENVLGWYDGNQEMSA